jgi:hypothetical protein
VTPRIGRFSFVTLGESAGFLLTLLGNWERNENASGGNVSPNVAERGRDILVGQRKLVSGTKTVDNSFEGGDASPPQFSWREPSMSEPGTRKRKRAGWILMTTSFLCATVVFFSLYFLHHFLLDLLVGIFSAALMLLCLVMFILKKP